MAEKAQHPMAVVTRRTGLHADVIRSWERRHKAIEPTRSSGNHRLFSDDDIQRLLLLRRALESGWHIGQVAGLQDDEIEELLADATSAGDLPKRERGRSEPLEPLLERCLDAIEAMDEARLRRELDSAAVELGRIRLLEGLLGPLMERLGSACAGGTLRIAHEHMASAAIRGFLESIRGAYPASDTAPAVVVTTPSQQHHELGAMLVAAVARAEGWRAIYLGPNLPAEEIGVAVRRPEVRALALSISSELDDGGLDGELRQIGNSVPDGVRIAVGGRASLGYLGALDAMGASRIADLREFREFLTESLPGVTTAS